MKILSNLRIALCGRGGTGKSTLARELSAKLQLPLITEGVRSVCGTDFGDMSIRNLNARDRLHLQIALLQNQLTTERLKPEGFISDRSVWDYYAYTAIYSDIEHSFYFQRAACFNDPNWYDYLILVPAFNDDPIEDDNFRFNSKRMLNMELDVEDILRQKADYVLESKSIIGRVEEVCDLIHSDVFGGVQ